MYYVYVQLIYNHVNTIWCTLYQVSYNYYYYQQQNYFNESIILQMPIISSELCMSKHLSGRNIAGRNSVLHYINSFVSSINTKILFFIFSEYVWNILNLVKVQKNVMWFILKNTTKPVLDTKLRPNILTSKSNGWCLFFFPDREYSMYLAKQELTSSKYE